MDVIALILAAVAFGLFVAKRADLGLAVLTAALVCQFVHLTGHLVHVN